MRKVAIVVALLAVAGSVGAQDVSEAESTGRALLGRMMWEAFMCEPPRECRRLISVSQATLAHS